MNTVFYAWQSDRPNNTNRGFIGKCLERALREINKSLPVAQHLRLDKDTQDVPGMVVISDVILEKIERCTLFVGDLSIVTQAGSGRQMPNGNVMFELGYAMRALSDRRIVNVFNTAFGSLDSLPFDIRHRRHPVVYSLEADATEEQRNTVREQLISALVDALQAAARQAVDGSPPARAAPLASVPFGQFELPGRFQNGQTIASVDAGTPGVGADGKVIYRHAPQAFLDLRPVRGQSTDTYVALRARLSPSSLRAFGPRGTQWVSRNDNGLILGDIFSRPQHPNALCFTQLYKATGALYGIDQACVRNDGERMFIHAADVRDDFIATLASYLDFYRKNPDLEAPLKLYAGFEALRDLYLAVPSPKGPRFAGPGAVSHLWHAVDAVALDDDPETLLRPLFEKLWDNVELPYPG